MLSFLSLLSLLHACLATTVYLSPQRVIPAKLPPSSASVTLAHHLGLEAFEPLDTSFSHDFEDPEFVGQGKRSGLILSVDEHDIQYVVPSSLKPTFTLINSPAVDSFASLISTYLGRAQHAYSSIFSTSSMPSTSHNSPRLLDIFDFTSSPEMEQFYTEFVPLVTFLDTVEKTPSFAAMELSGLSQVRQYFGSQSEEYKQAVSAARAALESAVAQSDKLHLALLTYSPAVLGKRQEAMQSQTTFPLPTQQPIGSVSSCFSSVDVCNNSTNTCSGRGECTETSRAGKACFVCACRSTKSSSGSTENWVGEKCERKDVSGPFTLLAGTTIAIFLFVAGSIYLLATIGNQELPSVLMGGVPHSKRE